MSLTPPMAASPSPASLASLPSPPTVARGVPRAACCPALCEAGVMTVIYFVNLPRPCRAIITAPRLNLEIIYVSVPVLYYLTPSRLAVVGFIFRGFRYKHLYNGFRLGFRLLDIY